MKIIHLAIPFIFLVICQPTSAATPSEITEVIYVNHYAGGKRAKKVSAVIRLRVVHGALSEAKKDELKKSLEQFLAYHCSDTPCDLRSVTNLTAHLNSTIGRKLKINIRSVKAEFTKQKI